MDDKLAIIEVENISVLNDIPFNKKSKRDRSVRKNENFIYSHSVVRQNEKDFPHISSHNVGSDMSLSFNKDLHKVAQEVVKSYKMKGSFEESKDQCVNETYNGESRTILKEGLNRKDAGDVNNNYILFEDPRKERVEVQVEHMQDCGDNIGYVSVEFGKNRNTLTLDDFVMPPMHESQLVALETGQSHVSSLVDVEAENRFVTPLIVAEEKKERAFSFLSLCQSSFTLLSSNTPFEFGVGRVNFMDWFYPLTYPGHPWNDLHVGMIMYYLRKFCKYGLDNSARVTTSDPFYISWVVKIHNAWEANGKDERLINTHHDVAQYIRGDKILANTPWLDVDYVRIPINYSDYGLYTICSFAGYVCRGYIISMSIFDYENLRLRYGILLSDYGKRKIDTGTASENEDS
ncbi:hypothetical protein H5410_027412 [Solanum commersonii]|uniref:Ulp1 protease family, C-terminal catalytic domain containing protein n=1 Tax=Solanum commersonii TaxID=4109 RepID=A0A9J5Z1S3_SOLCO|nr:hypothetical protein H5410_027412 [Solanum commersonii]